MHPKLKEVLSAVRPEYHKLPLTLTLKEIEDAVGTIQGIFDMYDLESFRTTLYALRNAALQVKDEELEVDAWNIVYMVDQLIRIVECNWVLYQRPKNDEYLTVLGMYRPDMNTASEEEGGQSNRVGE